MPTLWVPPPATCWWFSGRASPIASSRLPSSGSSTDSPSAFWELSSTASRPEACTNTMERDTEMVKQPQKNRWEMLLPLEVSLSKHRSSLIVIALSFCFGAGESRAQLPTSGVLVTRAELNAEADRAE